MKRKPRIAILGAGIMGSSLGLFLARKGANVTLFDKAKEPMSAASRWNEGKIHLGYLYAADPSLGSAEHVMPGGLKFRSLVEELLETSIESAITPYNDIFLCHRDSVVKPEAMESYMKQVTELMLQHPDSAHYLADFTNVQPERLNENALAELSGSSDIVAGFSVPEHSVETTWIADRFVKSLHEEEHIEFMMQTKIEAVNSLNGNHTGPWSIETSSGTFSSYDYVVNALWEGRMAIDLTVGIQPSGVWSNRYRQSLFVRTSKPVLTPSAIISTGPFGDIKNYNNRNFYLSWYTDGLRVDSSDIVPPEIESLDMPSHDFFSHTVFNHLQTYLPWAERIREHAEDIRVEGGWVFAAGKGKLSNPSSTLHKRSDYGIFRKGNYISVDTGKYSTAPLLAKTLADILISD